MIGLPEIRKLLPHRYPVLLVDRVVDLVPGTRVTAIKAVTANEPWYATLQDHDDHRYPQMLVVESWMQSAGLLICLGMELEVPSGHVMLAGRLTGVEFHRPVWPGDVLTHEVRPVRVLPDTVVVAGECTVDGRIVMTVSRALLAFRPGESLIEEGNDS